MPEARLSTTINKKNLMKTIRQINFAGRQRLTLFLGLPETIQAQVLSSLSLPVQKDLLKRLTNQKLVKILEDLAPDKVTDIIQLLPPKRQKKVTRLFEDEIRSSVEFLAQFNPRSAAGLMNLDYILVDENDTIAQTAQQFAIHEKRTGRPPTILVTKEGKLQGFLPGYKLGLTQPSEKVKHHIRPIPAVKHDASHNEVMKLFRTHPHNKLVVLGEEEQILGIIYSDDILKLLRKEQTTTIYDFAGVHDEESVFDLASQKVKHRHKWLIINLGTAFLAALTVGLFDEVIAKYVLLAAYMPIIAGMGGNAATQTLAVLVRGITLKQIDLESAWPTLKQEIIAGIANGIITGVLAGGVVLFLNHDLKIALILILAMIANLLIAGVFGTLVPLFMQRIGKDPATSATIFITTATDVLGFLTFLGLAKLLLG